MASEQQTESTSDLIETYPQEETEFYKPNLEPFKPPRFKSPKDTHSLIDTIRRNRLLVLGGSNEIDKSALARHLAWSLSEILKQASWDLSNPSEGSSELSNDLSINDAFIDEDSLLGSNSELLSSSSDGKMPTILEMPILEWYRSSSDPQSIEAKLLRITTPTIFILPKISPQDVRYDLSSINKAANKNQHFVIASTDVPSPSWKMPKDDQYFWYELLTEYLYDINDLADVLIQELNGAEESLPKGFLSEQLEPDQPLVDNMKIQEVAKLLKTPDNISDFVQLLCAEKRPLQSLVIKDLIVSARDKRRTLERWYPALSPREQLLALGLSFFDGLFDDQFFAAMERVIERVWQRRDPSLCALDYCDLDKLRNIFDLVPIEGYGTRIESRIPELRRTLFEIAWNSHRRYILAALPVIAQLAVDSVADRSLDPELYGTTERRHQLRMVTSEALCDIGVISVDAVQRTLLKLAADNDLGVQAVAARAMAQWRNYGRDTELFETLQDWQLQTRWSYLIEEILRQRNELKKDERHENSRDYIRATVALTVSYAAREDPRNMLNDNICKLLADLAEDQSTLVRNRFRSHTLPNVVPLHTKQLRGILHDMARYIDLIPAISNSLALAYRYNAEEVLAVLDEWHQECRILRPARTNPIEPNLREKLLATIAMTYGYIKYDDMTGILTTDEGFKRMQSILAEETHPFVRNYVVIAISLQAYNNFERVEPMLQRLVTEVDENESDKIVKILKNVYLEQRGNLKGGDDFIVVDEKTYPIWLNSERPLTAVERAMLRWIKDPKNPAAQQIATRASVVFANALEQKEAQQIIEIRERRNQPIEEATPEITAIPTSLQHVRESRFVEKIAIWIATLSAERFSVIIQGLMPEVLAQNKSNKQAMTFVLEKWRRAADNEIKTIAKLQERAIWLIEHSTLIGTLVLGGLILLIVGPIPKGILLVLFLCAFAIWWIKTRSSPPQKSEGMRSLSLRQNVLHLRDSLFR